MDERPRLRHVETFPVEVKGERAIALRDPAGWTESVLVVSPETTFVLSCFDGGHTLRDVQEACFRRFGEMVPVDRIHPSPRRSTGRSSSTPSPSVPIAPRSRTSSWPPR